MSGPEGAAASTVSVDGGRVEVAFTPGRAGTFRVTMHVTGGSDTFVWDVGVVETEPPDLTLPRGCVTVAKAAGLISCDDALFTLDGAPAASLPGGRWLEAGGRWLGWADGGLAFASLDAGSVSFGPPVAAPFPVYWSDFGGQLAIGTPDGGALYSMNIGALAPLRALPPGAVDVLADGETVTFRLAPFDPQLGQVWSANTERIIALTDGYLGSVDCFVPDGGALERQSCDGLRAQVHYASSAPDRPVPRRLLEQTTLGVRLGDGGAMDLVDAGRISAGDDFVWESNATQTAVWFR